MVNALAHLQAFAGGPEAAKCLLQADTSMTNPKRESVDFVLSSTRRGKCLTEPDADIEAIVYPDLQPVWNWFQAHAALTNKYSIYSLLFKLAKIGVAKEVGVESLPRELTIERLLGKNTWNDDDLSDSVGVDSAVLLSPTVAVLGSHRDVLKRNNRDHWTDRRMNT
jgi:hypothetical protein